jgi:agmatine deiminase
VNGRVPAEWAPHKAMWVGFPSHPDLWQENLEPARDEVAALVRALAGPGREKVRLLVATAEARAAAQARIDDPAVEIVEVAFGDIWLRDTGPIFLDPDQARAFAFNGWGGKYRLDGDETVADDIARMAGAKLIHHAFVLEGGALDHDGEGTALTTRQCLLNPNRNPGWTQDDAERVLATALGISQTIWLDHGLANDHTDGHVDNLARFIAPGIVACPIAFGRDDPNAQAYDAAAEALAGAADAAGRRLRVVRIPSPGRIAGDDGRSAPASHMNFLIAGGAVIAPTYEDVASVWAAEALRMEFPGREVIALPARALLTGGGAFHCISQQQPA